MASAPVKDRPVSYARAREYGDMLAIATHPAFRLGFLDAQSGKSPNQNDIIARIFSETPKSALKRLGWGDSPSFLDSAAVAEYRYEEGRMFFIELGLRCKGWGHPDYPPASIMKWIDQNRDQ